MTVALLAGAAAPLTAQKTIDLDAATIVDLNAAFKAGTLTAETLTQMCLARIQACDLQGPRLRAMITVNPKALGTDTGGPMARSVTDITVVLGLLTGIDTADPATRKSEGRFETDYTS